MVLAVVLTILFLWLIQDFVLTLIIAAILAALLYPVYNRLLGVFGNRKGMASIVTVLSSLLLLIIPIMLFTGILVSEAIEVSETAIDWVDTQLQDSENLKRQIEEDETLKKLLPYQDKILEKVTQLAGTVGSTVADSLVYIVQGTATTLFMLFILLYSMYFFLINGKSILDGVLNFTPLSDDDKESFLGIYTSVGRATLKGTLIIGIVQGGLAGLAFWVAGIDGVIFWSVIMAVLSILPGIGSALVWVPVVIFLAINGQITAAIGVALWCAIVVGTIDNVLRPILVGKDTKMPDLLVMLTTLGGLALFGAAGLFIGPIIGALFMAGWKLWGSTVAENKADFEAVE
jgi:predicted PurR-regulated permease PerM